MDNQGQFTGNIVDIHRKRIFFGQVCWQQGIITEIREQGPERPDQAFLMPGWIDAHVHIESSMLTPAEFGRIACRHGTVASVSDPHEIANVLGIEGIDFMANDGRRSPFRIFWGAPSCVPATAFETAGATLDAAELEQLFSTGTTGYLSEVMNFPGVLANSADIEQKLAVARRHQVPVDGHAPGLTGEAAARYAAAGISTDHECATLEEAQDKLKAGMSILIREGSAARNFDTLHPLISEWPDRVMFCSDDKHPDDLLEGHINRLITRALALGHELFTVLRCASLNPVRHYRLPVGLLRVGDAMDAVAVEDLQSFRVLATWIDGQQVAAEGKSLLPHLPNTRINRFAARPITPEDLARPAPPGVESPQIRVIQALDGELLTPAVIRDARVEQGQLVPDTQRDLLLLVVVNRYRQAPPAVAFIEGFGLKRGALASSVAHDSHNIIAVGTSAAQVCAAVNAVINSGGGIAVAHEETQSVLPLPVAGLMSDRDGDAVGRDYLVLTRQAHELGSPLLAPFMTLSFMALLVIPELKLSDLGLFDGQRFEFVDLLVDDETPPEAP